MSEYYSLTGNCCQWRIHRGRGGDRHPQDTGYVQTDPRSRLNRPPLIRQYVINNQQQRYTFLFTRAGNSLHGVSVCVSVCHTPVSYQNG